MINHIKMWIFIGFVVLTSARDITITVDVPDSKNVSDILSCRNGSFLVNRTVPLCLEYLVGSSASCQSIKAKQTNFMNQNEITTVTSSLLNSTKMDLDTLLSSGVLCSQFPQLSTNNSSNNNTTCTTNQTTIVSKCADGYSYFKRTPTSLNNYTSEWCLKILTTTEPGMNWNDANQLCANDGAVVSLYENANENKTVVAYIRNVTNYGDPIVVRINGHRKSICQTNPSDSQCSGGNAFSFNDSNTDPTYVLNTFAPGQPSYDIKYPDPMAQDCLAAWDYYGSSTDGEYISTTCGYYGVAVLCGKRPN